ncbi:hypothetical protein EP331_01830 [bacterium]|nr:MAG: hypothetical protein EP331_01830 [bacterium]
MKSFFTYLSVFSVDVALGAVCSAVFAGQIVHGISINWIHLGALFFAVIGIYTFDHVFDLSRIHQHALSPRRQIHAQQKTKMLVVMILSLIIAACLSLFLPRNVQIVGLIIAGFMGVYFYSVSRFDTQKVKDIGVSLGYASGIWLPIWASSAEFPPVRDWLMFSLFVINTLLIMMLYAKIDAHADRQESLESFVESHKWFFWLASKLPIIFILMMFWAFIVFDENEKLWIWLPIVQFVAIRLMTRFKMNTLSPVSVRYFGEYSYLIYGCIWFLT